MRDNLTRQELVELVRQLMNAVGTEEENGKRLQLIQLNVPDPYISDLIFWPNTRNLPDNLPAEQIVDIALNYKPNPIALGSAKLWNDEPNNET